MDYKLNVYTSSEKEMNEVVSRNPTKQVKAIGVKQKLPAVYKKVFGAAVKKYDEHAITGRLINNYYKAICNSNIPEVYELSIIVKYELQNANDLNTIKRVFADFKKLFEKQDQFALVTAYNMSYDEFKELVFYFVPVADGYLTGLSVRNDLIDVARKMSGREKEKMDIIQAMPIFIEEVDKLFQEVNKGEIMNQKELEDHARKYKEEDPAKTHVIEIETLQMHMNNLNSLNQQNQEAKMAIEREKQRIRDELVWTKQAEQQIVIAEQQRIEEEKLAKIRAEEERKRQLELEAQREEEARLAAESAEVERQRLEEQERRNRELMNQAMILEPQTNVSNDSIRMQWNLEDFVRAVQRHQNWERKYKVRDGMLYDEIPTAALTDPDRMVLKNLDLNNISFNRPMQLIGVQIEDCLLMECDIRIELIASSISKISVEKTVLDKITLKNCVVDSVDLTDDATTSVVLDNTIVIDSVFKKAELNGTKSINGSKFTRCNFSEARMEDCDMKQTTFRDSNFNGAMFKKCDMRNTLFDSCDTSDMKNSGSIFRGAQKR